MRFAELDAVTIDGYGTLVRLIDPAPALVEALARHEAVRTAEDVSKAFTVEGHYYRQRSYRGRDEASLAELQIECAGVFLGELSVDVPASEFVEEFVGAQFVGALRFEPVPGAVGTLELLRDRGLRLAVVADWDCALPEHLDRLGLAGYFAAVATSAEAGAPKPEPAVFRLALAKLGVEAARALHVGDEPRDEEGAHRAGMCFAPAPLATAFEGWT